LTSIHYTFDQVFEMQAVQSFTDGELLALLREGDSTAFSRIYNRYFSTLYLHAYNRLRSKEEAKDVVQELFVTLWLKHDTLAPKTNLSNYLYTSVRNRILNRISHLQVEERYRLLLPETINMEACVTDYSIREKQLAEIIEKEIQALPAKMRKVFEMSRKDSLTYKEIADQLSLSEQSVRSHVKGALKILKSKLGFVAYLSCIFF
jgi:RNA polymerase sigma-70 factor (family 1)